MRVRRLTAGMLAREPEPPMRRSPESDRLVAHIAGREVEMRRLRDGEPWPVRSGETFPSCFEDSDGGKWVPVEGG